MAIAVERIGASTAFTMAAFKGPVFRKRRNSEIAKHGTIAARGP
jgi:hypothetical protein